MKVAPSRAHAIRKRLLSWWDAGHRELPWRFPQDAADPYRVWIAEVMLQQTRVPVVIPYYRRFVARFPTLDALARADDDEVLALWSGLGYYARGRRLAAAAREALARHGGLPASPDALRALPGFGPYTAGAVASIAFAVRAPCVDGNVQRVLRRLFLAEAPPSAAGRAATWALAGALVPRARPGDFNQALMELGALVCAPARPACERCPVERVCRTRAAGRERAPGVLRRRPAPRAELACALIRRGGQVLLARQAGDGLFGGLWGLPFALARTRGRAVAQLASVVDRALGVAITPGPELATVERILTHRRLRLRAYDCGELPRSVTLPAGYRFQPLLGSGMRPPPWRSDSPSGGISTAMRALLDAVLQNGRNALTRRGVPV